jgi:hypothetical protein
MLAPPSSRIVTSVLCSLLRISRPLQLTTSANTVACSPTTSSSNGVSSPRSW